eukprot:4328092-Pleurochrysis_carterae.AAC.1
MILLVASPVTCRLEGPSLRQLAGRRELPIWGAVPPRYTVRACTYEHQMHNYSCAASNEWRDSVRRAALTVQLLGGYPLTPPAAGPVSRPRPLSSYPSLYRTPCQ